MAPRAPTLMHCNRRFVDAVEGSADNMLNAARVARTAGVGFGLLGLLGLALAGAPPPVEAVAIRTSAQKVTHLLENGSERDVLGPADRVVPGDEVLYTIEVRNPGNAVLRAPSFTVAIPQHMTLVPDSAIGPGAEVSYSIDGGHVFDEPETLTVAEGADRRRPARPADYTHMRWTLHIQLRAAAVAFVRYRAILH